MNGLAVNRGRSLTARSSDSEALEYVDASEEVIYGQSLELLDTIAETTITMNLFLNNKFDLAEERMAELHDKSMYHALGYTCILFIKAMMTCDRADMERAMLVCKNATTVIEKYKQKMTLGETLSYYSFGSRQKPLTDEELHAELCYAECGLVRAMLTFFHDETLASFVRGGLKIRSCYQTFKQCHKLLENDAVWAGRDPEIKNQFEAGVRMGIGAFNLMLSVLPSKVLRLLEVVGFSGNKATGMSELIRASSMEGTLRAPLCATMLCVWHLLASFLVGVGKPDIRMCNKLLPGIMAKYPKGAIPLFLKARLLLVTGDINSAIYNFNMSIEAQDCYKQFHHGCYWELLFAHSYLRQWAKAANYAKKLVNESKWSRCVYTYMLAIYFSADETIEEKKRIETVNALAKKVDGFRLRIAGKSIPVEKFCSRRAKRFLATNSFVLAHYEFVYFWNGFDIMGRNEALLVPILEDIDRVWERHKAKADTDEECLYYLLRGVCLKSLDSLYQAQKCFEHVISCSEQIVELKYLVPNATFELGSVMMLEGSHDTAMELLAKARAYKGYSLENKLHFRIHGLMDQMEVRTPV
ncbi:unnamed protein product, partial [Mesorhabditis spiculigera]